MADKMDRHADRLCRSTSLWEPARAIARRQTVTTIEARRALGQLLADLALKARLAVEAHNRYGKGRHAAALNTGDCFAYACGKTNNARLRYTGDDFSKTDLA